MALFALIICGGFFILVVTTGPAQSPRRRERRWSRTDTSTYVLDPGSPRFQSPGLDGGAAGSVVTAVDMAAAIPEPKGDNGHRRAKRDLEERPDDLVTNHPNCHAGI
jgi:hypothetical protein